MKKQLAIPTMIALVAVIALAVPPIAMAEESDMHEQGKYAKHHKKHRIVEVPGFVGQIAIPEDMNRDSYKELKDQVTVSLLDAATVADESGITDVKRASIGVVKDENDNKYVAWILASMDISEDSELTTKTIFVVDAADATNTATVTKEFDPSERKEMKMEKRAEKIDRKLDKIQDKLEESTGNPELDALRNQFYETLQDLRNALQNGDSDTAKQLRDELRDLRNQMNELRNA